MGVRGPKPAPAKIKALKGKSHKKKRETLYIEPSSGLSLPKDLPEKVRVRAQEVLDILSEKRILTPCDLAAFARYCEHLELAHEAKETLDTDGLIVRDERGLARKHPAAQIFRDNSLAALRFEEQFGLTPSSRERLSSPEDRKDDEYGVFRSSTG
ncbi:MAG: phage terminase small subunit P27 family [Aminobacterium sp.]|uniref:phage terminase small subunit P27 family n=1 Tax=Aminobacterium sp. TaxID=1872491 RepID=UPI002B21427D|nr:phage terminase small subunit P27 family [Aminobacterium sp.]MEA4876819.1 phage terminase small subunit P27 family [Aminobacterium sp.]